MTGAEEGQQRQRRQAAEVVMYWMRRRGLTRQVFADRLGKSLSWVDKIRNGDRQLDRLSVLRRIARVLDIPLQVLIEPAEAERRRHCPDDREIDAIRSALRRYDTITNVFRPNDDVLPEPDVARLERSVRHGWMAFQVSNYQAAYGMLLLKGSIAAARLHRATDVRDLQTESLRVAAKLDTNRVEHWSSFGTTNVQIHRVSALADMHGGGRVVEAAAKIATADLVRLPRERRASHLVEVARGYVQWGRRDEASSTLLAAHQLAPEEVRCRGMTRQLMTDLIRSYPRGTSPPAALTAVARAVGVAV